MTCPHASISLPTTSDPDTVCADCGAVVSEAATRFPVKYILTETKRGVTVTCTAGAVHPVITRKRFTHATSCATAKAWLWVCEDLEQRRLAAEMMGHAIDDHVQLRPL